MHFVKLFMRKSNERNVSHCQCNMFNSQGICLQVSGRISEPFNSILLNARDSVRAKYTGLSRRRPLHWLQIDEAVVVVSQIMPYSRKLPAELKVFHCYNGPSLKVKDAHRLLYHRPGKESNSNSNVLQRLDLALLKWIDILYPTLMEAGQILIQ